METLPGYEIRAVLGEVLGVTACTRNPYVAGLRTLDGARSAEMANVLVQNRATAIGQMIFAARRRGATAIIGMRFDNREIDGRWVEICAYGTAVRAEPVSEEARRQHEAMVGAGQIPEQPTPTPTPAPTTAAEVT